MKDAITPGDLAKGRVRACTVRRTRADIARTGDNPHPDEPLICVPTTEWVPNDILFSWAGPVAKLLTQGLTNFRISGMYLEYENVADPDDPVSVPTFNRSGGKEYYTGLAASPTRDYLRVALTASNLKSTDLVKFPDGNLMTFFAQTQGVVGTNGKPFSATDNSKVYGGALVTFVDQADDSQDIIFSRFYFDAADQQVKLDSSQIGLEWETELQ